MRMLISHSFSRRYWPILPAIASARWRPARSRRARRQAPSPEISRVVAEGHQGSGAGARVPAPGRPLQVCATRHFERLEDDGQRCDMVVLRRRARGEMGNLEQVLQAQQGADALVERIFVANHRSVSACIAPVQSRADDSTGPFPPWRGTVSVRRRGEVGGVQAIDLCVQGCRRAGVVEHVVGGGQTLRPTGLRGHDGAICSSTSRRCTHARDLQRLGTVDHADAVAALAVMPTRPAGTARIT